MIHTGYPFLVVWDLWDQRKLQFLAPLSTNYSKPLYLKYLTIKDIKSPLLAALSGILLALTFPRYNLEVLAWVAWIPLFFAIENKTPFLCISAGGGMRMMESLISLSQMTRTTLAINELKKMVYLT